MYYPRSFPKFLLLGFLLVSLPLGYALFELARGLDRLTRQSEAAVVRAAQAGRLSRQLREQTTALERIVRQYLILEDELQLDDYGRVRQDFRQNARTLRSMQLDPEAQEAIDRLLEREAELEPTLREPRSPAQTAALAEGYAELADISQAALAGANRHTEAQVERLRETAEGARQNLLLLSAAAVGIAVVLAALFSWLLSRPIRQIDEAIRQIGRADFAHPIEVTGPEDLRYLGQRLEWLRSRLNDLEAQQNKFLRHVSHELKTPLTAVREGAELLRDRVGGELSAEQQEIVRIVHENTLQLQKLIEDLLQYQQTRAEAPPARTPVVVSDVVRRVVKEQRLAAFARAITIEARLEPLVVAGDAEKIRVVVDNLLSNAIKFSPHGGTVGLKLRGHDGYADLEVIDQGPGVPEADRERVFESFYRGEATAEGPVKGSGLGLAIAREYATAHGGSITVLPPEEGDAPGARFRVLLPLQAG